MKLSDILTFGARDRKARESQASAATSPVPLTTYRRKTRRAGGVTFVGIPNKIAKRMGR